MTSPAHRSEPGLAAARWRSLALLSLAELLAMSVWFSASAVLPQLTAEWELGPGMRAWMTIAVQIGFVTGALLSAGLNLADRLDMSRLIAVSTILAAAANGAIVIFDEGPWVPLVLRFLTGAALACVYPPGMKLMATWTERDRGLAIGILIGALTLGSALPHLLNALPLLGEGGMPPWRSVLLGTSLMAAAGGLTAALFVRRGPFLAASAPFNWKFALEVFKDRPTRLANFGYLGHMWELYAMWAWTPLFLMASYEAAGLGITGARLAGFGAIAIGGVGCVMAGRLADRFGRCAVGMVCLVASGTCALLAGFFFDHPLLLTVVCLVWGFTVVPDSAQFSAAVTELTDPRYVGTALTMQTSLGFLLTVVTIQVVPPLVERAGWGWVFALLAAGPALGAVSMWKLRGLPEAAKMASGNR